MGAVCDSQKHIIPTEWKEYIDVLCKLKSQGQQKSQQYRDTYVHTIPCQRRYDT